MSSDLHPLLPPLLAGTTSRPVAKLNVVHLACYASLIVRYHSSALRGRLRHRAAVIADYSLSSPTNVAQRSDTSGDKANQHVGPLQMYNDG